MLIQRMARALLSIAVAAAFFAACTAQGICAALCAAGVCCSEPALTCCAGKGSGFASKTPDTCCEQQAKVRSEEPDQRMAAAPEPQQPALVLPAIEIPIQQGIATPGEAIQSGPAFAPECDVGTNAARAPPSPTR